MKPQSYEQVQLRPEQQQAVEVVLQQLKGFSQFVLEGVTGSGKTEVYCQVIQQVLAQGKQALVLVPEIGLTPQTVARFVQRCGVKAVLMHSKLTEQQKLDAWLMAKTGVARLVIGTRSALFAPLAQLGIVVVDESHDGSFKQQSGCCYSARDVAMKWAQINNIPIVIGTATPSLETLRRVQEGHYQHLRLSAQAMNDRNLTIKLVDMRGKKLDDGVELSLKHQMQDILAQGQQVLLFLNRRGFAPVMLCHHCGWSAECHSCESNMVLHQSPEQLRCHQCNRQTTVPQECPKCGASSWLHVGLGTQRLEQLISKWFPERQCLRVDRDVVTTTSQLDRALTAIHQGQVDVVIGTQMIAKGHDFRNVGLVAVLDCDSHLFHPDFRAVERLAQTLVQVAGRAGRHATSATVWLQTHHPQHEVFAVLSPGGYPAWVQSELRKRQACQLPPYHHLAIIHFHAHDQQKLAALTQHLQPILVQLHDMSDLMVVGPLPSLFPKRKGYWRYTLNVTSPKRNILHGGLAFLRDHLSSMPCMRSIKWRIEVDPTDLG